MRLGCGLVYCRAFERAAHRLVPGSRRSVGNRGILRCAGWPSRNAEAAGSAGFLLFLCGSACIWILFAVRQPLFTQWDEFTAWGLAPKMVAIRSSLYVADPVNLTASFTYPGTSLLSYLFQCTPGTFSEWQCMAALDILALAAFAPAAALPRARWPHSILLFAAGFLLPFFFNTAPVGTASTVYQNAMADLPLAVLFGGALCLYFAAGERRGGFYAVGLPLALLAMTKDIGFAYGLIAAFIIGIDQVFAVAQAASPRHIAYRIGRSLVLALPVLAVFLSWNRYTAAMSPDAGANGRQRPDGVCGCPSGRDSAVAWHRA